MMYAPLQQAWTRDVVLSGGRVAHFLKSLMVFLASFSLLGWTYALMALGVFCAYQNTVPSLVDVRLNFSPERVRWQAVDDEGQCRELTGRPQAVSVGWCYLSFTLQQQDITVWQWQMPDAEWRRLRTMAIHVWLVAK